MRSIHAACRSDDQEESADEHRYGKPLPHVEAGPHREADKLGIWLAEELYRETGEAIADEEYANEHTRSTPGVREPEQEREQREQREAFKPGLIELAWMTREA
ncbi:hypothetical protein LTR94_035509, partial [Friedmanniomyces endolithicus]